jgi:hypothetical protein
VEAERGREGGLARRGAARRRGVGATVESGGVGATRSTWLIGGPGRDGGPGRQRRGEAVGASLTGGVGSTLRPIRFSNRIKFAPNFDRSKMCLPVLQKFQIKYGWKGLVIRNNFPYRNFSRFEIEFEQEFRELL